MTKVCSLNPDQREIVELLCNDLADAMAEGNETLANPETRLDGLNDFFAHADHLAKAMQLAGLDGLQSFCEILRDNFTALLDNHNPLNDEFVEHLGNWPMALLGYLHLLLENVTDDESWDACIDELTTYLAHSEWPCVIDKKAQDNLRSTLHNASIAVETDHAAGNLIVDAKTASLDYGEDVRPELVQGMLSELPEQGRLFESSISQYLQHQDLTSLVPAQRVAHTIKGAANIVGIQGLANLMHLCEDLLIDISKGKPLGENIDNLLMDAADCLGDICDYLTGLTGKPDSIEHVLQALIDCFPQGDGSPTDNNVAEELPQDNQDIHFDGLDELEFTENLNDFNQADFQALDKELDSFSELQDLTFEANSPNDPQEQDPVNAATDLTPPNPTTPATKKETKTAVDDPRLAEEFTLPAQNTEQDTDNQPMLSIPQRSAQQLLRIAGEATIANTQVMAQLNAMRNSIEQTERYHKRIKTMALELEALLQTQNALRSAMYRSRGGDQQDNADFDPLEMESYSELHSFSNQLLELTADSYEGVNHIEAQIEELTSISYAQRQLNRDNNDLLLQTHMVPVDNIVPRLQRCVRQACRLTKKAVNIEVIGETLHVDNRVLGRIVDPLMHLLRNAVDHGIESDEQRLEAGKDPTGSIVVEFIQRGEIIVIECRDDGRGLDFTAIRNKAIEQNLIEHDDELDESALSHLLFMPGFSTREVVSQTSGRGIGLDVVQEEVKQLKGSVQVSSAPNGGCSFTLTLPASILTAHGLLVTVANQYHRSVMSILSRGIHNIVYVDDSALAHSGDNTTYLYNDTKIPVYSLHDLTGTALPDNQSVGALLIVERQDQEYVAVSVESIVASQDLVIKPLNDFTYRTAGVVGATILGDGTVSSVLDLKELPGLNLSQEEFHRIQAQRAAIAAQERSQQWQLPTALIIDDSLSARQSLSQFVSELGMQVKTAKDGFEAITVLNETRPNVILVDLEMPRMNGLEFTAHLRADESTKDIPVIMITSRSTDKHRQMAQKAGVDDYINKPWSDEALLTSIQQQMEKAPAIVTG